MPRAVREALLDVLLGHQGEKETENRVKGVDDGRRKEAEASLKAMEDGGRFVQETW